MMKKIKNNLTKEKYEYYCVQLKKLAEHDNAEETHSDADSILCAILNDLGLEEIVELYGDIDKWYA